MQNIIEGFRLSPQQVRMWLLQQESDAYRAHCVIELKGTLKVDLLLTAAEKVLHAHESYRTCFHRLPGVKIPVQVVDEECLFTWRYVDLSAFPAQEQARRLEELAREDRQRPLDMEHGPLQHFSLITLSPQSRLLLLYTHPLLADAQTLQNFVAELARFYAADASFEDASDDLIQYTQFAEWQNSLLEEEEDSAKGRAFWQKQALMHLAAPHLPFAKGQRGQEGMFTPASLPMLLDSVTLNSIKLLVEKHDSNISTFLLACWSVLLGRLTGQEAFVVGVGVDGRDYEELAQTAGLLAKYLPLPCYLTADQTFSEVLAAVQRATNEALKWHQYFAGEGGEHSSDAATLPITFPLSYDFRQEQAPSSANGVTFSLATCTTYFEPFTVRLSALQSTDTLTIEFHYDTNLVSIEDMQCLAAEFNELVESALKQPEAKISDLNILSASEHYTLLIEFNATSVAYPREHCIHELVEEQVTRTPDALALVFEQAHLTYAELDARANQLGRYLQQQGVGPGTLVGICLPRSLEMVIGMLGILKAGAAYVPLDPATPVQRVAMLLADASIGLLLTQQELLPRLAEVQSLQTTLLCLDSDWPLIARYAPVRPTCAISQDDLAYVIYTSGSTGQPKGVLIPHRGLVNYVCWACKYYDAAAGHGSVVHSSLAFDLPITGLFVPLLVGGTVVLVSEEEGVDGLSAVLKRQGAFSLLKLTPAHVALLSQSLTPAELQGAARALVIGGEALLGESLQVWGRNAPSTRLINEYGPTESVVGCCIYEVPAALQAEGAIPIGHPIANSQLYVLDADLRPTPRGVAGELYIGGDGLAWGYLGRPELTAERFVPHPFSEQPGARLYRSGDMVRFSGAAGLAYLGRTDQQVKIRGYRVELGEIEAVVKQYEGIVDSVVVVREREQGEHLQQELVAYVVSQAGTELATEEWRQRLQQKLPTYMLPTHVVHLEQLPLTTNGKIDRRALPAPEEQATIEAMRAPRSPIEEILVQLWCEILGLKQVGIDENFFERGGHSLLATQLIARVQSIFQVEMTVRSVFEAATVAELAAQVENKLQAVQGIQTPPITPIPRFTIPPHDPSHTPLPLSFAQQRLWFLDQLEPGTNAYNIPVAVHIQGDLQVEAFERSLTALVERHEGLRTTFVSAEGEPLQVISAVETLRVPVVDMRSLAQEKRLTATWQIADEEAARPFDLSRGPLLRVGLLHMDEGEYVLLLTMHHIISDGWSMGIFVRELSALYNAFRVEQPSPLPTLPIQYADFAHWQREWLQGETLQRHVSYWTKQLAGIQPLEFPTDRPRPARQTFAGASHELLLPASLSAGLKQLSQREGVTLFMVLLGAFQTLLSRYTGQQDIAVGTLIANRNRSEIEGVIGIFINALVMRTDLAGNPTFRALLGRVREVALEAYAHQDLPFEKLVEVLQPERDPSRPPLFQVLLMLQNMPTSNERLAGLSLQAMERERRTANFDITLSITDTGQELRCLLEYNTDLFDHATIARLQSHWQTLLTALVADPTQSLAALPLLTSAERQQVVVEWNATQGSDEQTSCIHALIEKQVRDTPDAVAATFGDEYVSYAVLNGRANQLARYLCGMGVAANARVGLCLERSLAVVVGMLGILKAGAAYVPLDPSYPRERLVFMQEQAQVAALVTRQSLAEQLALPHGQVVCLDTDWERIALEDAADGARAVRLDDMAYVIYTSGSTGQPKATGVFQRGVVNLLQWFVSTFAITSQDRVLVATSLSFDLTQKNIFAPLLVGGTLDLLPIHHYDPEVIVHTLAERQTTLLNCAPSAFYPLVADRYTSASFAPLSSLRYLFLGGEPVIAYWLQHWMAASNFQTTIVNTYGPTECTDIATFHVLQERDVQEDTKVVPIGKPITNVQVVVVDAFLQPVPVGVAGELCIVGTGVGVGYLNDAQLTAARFVPNPFSELAGTRLYKTGDRACYLADGTITFLGRVDRQAKVRGYRVEPGEIEAVLGRHPQVQGCVVLVREDGAEKLLVAYVVARGSQEQAPSSHELREYLQGELPAYMLPSFFVPLDALPLTTNGKVDQRALPAPTVWKARQDTGGNENAAYTPIEEMLAGIWREVLGLTHVGRDENFFELGGHSLLATQLLARIRAVMQVEMSLLSVFESPTVAGMAVQVERSLRGEQGMEMRPLVPVSRAQELPLSFAQQRLWFLNQLQPDDSAYNIPLAVRLEGMLNAETLDKSLTALGQRHESLRTTFAAHAGHPIQVISTHTTHLSIAVVDLQGLSEPERLREARRLTAQEAQMPFDLRNGPLLRMRVLRLQDQEQVLLLTLHHIIADAWSLGILFYEFCVLYNALLEDRPAPLHDLPIQYADFAHWQRERLQGVMLEREVGYWREQLRDAVPLELPTDHPRPLMQSTRGASQAFQLTPELSQALSRLSQHEGVTLFMTLLAAFQILLYRVSGQRDIVVGTDIANRTQLETEGLIGFFVNLLALRTNLSGTPSYRQVLRQVRDVVVNASLHQEVPFDQLVHSLRLERHGNQTPLVRVLLVLQNVAPPQAEWPGITAHPFGSEMSTVKFDLALFLQESAQGLSGLMNYSTDLFAASTIAQLVKRFEALLQAIANEPDAPIDTLNLTSAAEKEQQEQQTKERNATRRSKLKSARGEAFDLP